MKVLVTFALENEFAPWRDGREFRPGKWGDADVQVAKFGEAEVGVLLTGAGPKHARAQVSKIFRSENEPMNFCVSSGLAGALRAEYQVGNLLAARSVFLADASPDEPDALIESSAALLSFAAEYGATLVDRFHSMARVVITAAEKKYLGEKADAVEMESFAILREAQRSGIPAIAIRAISDGLGQDMPLDMNEIFTEDGQVSIPRVMAQVALHPSALPGLMELAQQSKRAAGSLCEFLDRYVAKLAETAAPLEPRSAAATQ